MDYMKFVEYHRSEGADITVGCLPVDYERASDFGLMNIDDSGRVTVSLLPPCMLTPASLQLISSLCSALYCKTVYASVSARVSVIIEETLLRAHVTHFCSIAAMIEIVLRCAVPSEQMIYCCV